MKVSGEFDMANFGIGCKTAAIKGGTLQVKGTWTIGANNKLTDGTTTTGTVDFTLGAKCLEVSGTTTNCTSIASTMTSLGFESADCKAASAGGCDCTGTVNHPGSIGVPSSDPQTTGKVTPSGNEFGYPDDSKYSYCVKDAQLTITPQSTTPALTGTIVLTKQGGGGSGGAGAGGTAAGGSGAGGGPGSGGKPGSGGTPAGGAGGAAGRDGGSSDTPAGSGGVGAGGGPGTGGGGGGARPEGPCDIYAAANMPCVAAYSMVRALSKTYNGPLYQVRNGSNATNSGTGGTTKDIGITADGYADTATQDAFCTSTCTVSLLYDQSGNDNKIGTGTKGNYGCDTGDTACSNDYESSATKGTVTAGGHKVYSLYMAAHDGYRSPLNVKGKNVPVGKVPQGIYELVDGTRYGDPCCWDFGNVSPDPKTYADMNTLFFGKAYWGNGAGSAPWFMADFEAGVWAGGSKVGDPGWGALNDAHPSNPNNPSMKGVAFAMGILKTDSSKWTLRMADIKSADLSTAWDGALPKPISNAGGIVLGVGGDNSNHSYGTFYEGAIVSGFPTAATDLAVMKNIQAIGYTK
jgi:hypothetical protein